MMHCALKTGVASLSMALSLLGVTARAAATNDAKKAPVGSAPKTAPAVPEVPMGKVDGVEVKRGTGYFGVALVSGNFKITFYDGKKHEVPAPFSRAALRWPVNYRPADERTVLNLSGDGKSLVSSKVVKPPYQFKLFITFLAEGADETVAGPETFSVDFRG